VTKERKKKKEENRKKQTKSSVEAIHVLVQISVAAFRTRMCVAQYTSPVVGVRVEMHSMFLCNRKATCGSSKLSP
jgi:translation initiation factor IF-3